MIGIVAIALVVGTALVTREVWPRTEKEVIRIPEPVVIDLSDSTRANHREAVAARDAMIERQARQIAALASRPPVVTAETTFVERAVEVACSAEFEPRWRVVDLTVGTEPGERTIMRSELYAATDTTIVITPRTEQHVTLGPLRGVFPKADGTGVRVEFDDWPEDDSCGFWCTMGHVGIGAAIGAGTTAAACIAGG